MEIGDTRHRVQVGDLVRCIRWSMSVDPADMDSIGLIVGWSPRRAVANVIFEDGIRPIHVKKIKVINESR